MGDEPAVPVRAGAGEGEAQFLPEGDRCDGSACRRRKPGAGARSRRFLRRSRRSRSRARCGHGREKQHLPRLEFDSVARENAFGARRLHGLGRTSRRVGARSS
jgi:hypothetical protein